MPTVAVLPEVYVGTGAGWAIAVVRMLHALLFSPAVAAAPLVFCVCLDWVLRYLRLC